MGRRSFYPSPFHMGHFTGECLHISDLSEWEGKMAYLELSWDCNQAYKEHWTGNTGMAAVNSISISGMLPGQWNMKPTWPPMEGNFVSQFQSPTQTCTSVLVSHATFYIFWRLFSENTHKTFLQKVKGKDKVPLFILNNPIRYVSCSTERSRKGRLSWVQCYWLQKWV